MEVKIDKTKQSRKEFRGLVKKVFLPEGIRIGLNGGMDGGSSEFSEFGVTLRKGSKKWPFLLRIILGSNFDEGEVVAYIEGKHLDKYRNHRIFGEQGYDDIDIRVDDSNSMDVCKKFAEEYKKISKKESTIIQNF